MTARTGHHAPPSPASVASVAAGGLLGAAARQAVEQAVASRPGSFPVATFVVNLSGAFLLGALLEALARAGDDNGARRRLRLVAGTGFLGAYTTYSALAVEGNLLVRGGHAGTAALYALATVFAGAGVAAIGIRAGAAGHRVTRLRWIDPDLDDEPDQPGQPGQPEQPDDRARTRE